MGVVQTKRTHHDELRHHVHLPRHRDGGNIAQEEEIAPFELQLRKRIGCERGGQELQKGNDDRKLRSILDERPQGYRGPDFQIVLPAWIGRDPLDGEGEHILVQLQRRTDHPDKGKQHGKGTENEQDVENGRDGLGLYGLYLHFRLPYCSLRLPLN